MLLALSLLGIVQQCQAFTLLAANRRFHTESTVRAASNDDEYTDDDESSIPQLPAIGESSFGTKKSPSLSDQHQPSSLEDGEKRAVAFVSDKFELQYTCKICDTRNAHRVSRLGEYL